jgi:predicted nuclease with TOPRIM domain
MRGYAVQCFTDAPMRVRAWFETLDEAESYGRRTFGTAAFVEGLELHTDRDEIAEQLKSAQDEAYDAKAEARMLEELVDQERADVQRLKGKLEELTKQGVLNARAG